MLSIHTWFRIRKKAASSAAEAAVRLALEVLTDTAVAVVVVFGVAVVLTVEILQSGPVQSTAH